MRALFLTAAFAIVANVATAADQKIGDLIVRDAWSRATAPTAPTGAVYFSVANNGKNSDRLVGIETEAAKMSQLHESSMDAAGVMKMEEMKQGLAIPAGETVTLKPGAGHVMLMGLTHPLKQGDTLPLTLTFEKAGKVEIIANVQAMGAGGPAAHDHMHH